MPYLITTPDDLRKRMDYDPATGELTWRERPLATFKTSSAGVAWNKRFAGKPALASINAAGYRCGNLAGRNRMAHRIAWYHYYGVWPDGHINHINGIRTDNRIENLRLQ